MTVFTKDFDESSILSLGDRYLMSVVDYSSDDSLDFQEFKYFSLNKDKKMYEINASDIDLSTENTVDTADNTTKYNDVTWNGGG